MSSERKIVKENKPVPVSYINGLVKRLDDKSQVSDGSHTFGELYRHRYALFISLVNNTSYWREKSYLHHDFTNYDGYFIVTGVYNSKNISYHLPNEYREKVDCEEVAKAKEWDGHTSEDVINTLLM